MNGASIISESNYQEMMEMVVIPYLKERMEELHLERKPGKSIYCAFYRADNPKGIIVISHGFTESAEKYAENAYYFVNEGYHTYVIEHCGHGRSYRLTDDPSLVHIDRFERYAEDLLFAARTAKQAHPDLPLYLFAHSMGGGIGAVAAAVAPELFTRVILTSPMIRPATGDTPWLSAYFTSDFFCKIGKGEDYIPGAAPYQGLEKFEDSAALSRPRFDYYQQIRLQEELFHTCAASFGWLREAFRMNRFLQTRGWKRIQSPVLLLQAEQEYFVSNEEQDLFVQKINSLNDPLYVGEKTILFAQKICIPDSKHEIYSSGADALKLYWEKIFDFLNWHAA